MPESGLLVEHRLKPFILAILAERKQHHALGYDVTRDATLTAVHWVAILARQLGLAIDDGAEVDVERFRRQMYRICSVCLAALETLDSVAADPEPAGPTEEQRGKGY